MYLSNQVNIDNQISKNINHKNFLKYQFGFENIFIFEIIFCQKIAIRNKNKLNQRTYDNKLINQNNKLCGNIIANIKA
jgi:hypothetical protein